MFFNKYLLLLITFVAHWTLYVVLLRRLYRHARGASPLTTYEFMRRYDWIHFWWKNGRIFTILLMWWCLSIITPEVKMFSQQGSSVSYKSSYVPFVCKSEFCSPFVNYFYNDTREPLYIYPVYYNNGSFAAVGEMKKIVVIKPGVFYRSPHVNIEYWFDKPREYLFGTPPSSHQGYGVKVWAIDTKTRALENIALIKKRIEEINKYGDFLSPSTIKALENYEQLQKNCEQVRKNEDIHWP